LLRCMKITANIGPVVRFTWRLVLAVGLLAALTAGLAMMIGSALG
jgi:hypothetical protein